jgi:nucleolar protein 12
MRKLAREELKEQEQRKKAKIEIAKSDDDDTLGASEESDHELYTIPKHETQVESAEPKGTDELEKASRTVFLGNVSSEAITSKAAKKALIKHLASFVSDPADSDPPHKVESLRFRSTAFASALPKKAAFAKKEIMDATTKSTNAYAVYSTKSAAREAAKRLNGTIVLGRHLRVDSLAHPAKTDHRRCVFVGNLGFVDDESNIQASEKEGEKKKKNKPPGDAEEGLWVHFSKAGKVESVRVVRDSKTRVGKGFAYVQFEDENSVEAALQFSEQKFPPLLPRKLRVLRAKATRKDRFAAREPKPKDNKLNGVYNAKISNEQRSAAGRAKAMLSKTAAAKAPELFVFEGHRASSKQGNHGVLKTKKGKKGKPSNRSTNRAAAWRKAGGKGQFK